MITESSVVSEEHRASTISAKFRIRRCGAPCKTFTPVQVGSCLRLHLVLAQEVTRRIAFGLDNVDLYIGGMVEDPVADGIVGPTMACIIGNQFSRLREGDRCGAVIRGGDGPSHKSQPHFRFWYQNPATFTTDQLAELEKVTMARILCDNGDGFQSMPTDVFAFNAGAVACGSIPAMDLSKWTE